MKCPRDGTGMRVEEHEAGFEVDRCPTCNGEWLDKGELEAVKAKVEMDFEMGWLVDPGDMNVSFSRKRQEEFGPIDCPRCGARMDVTEYEGWKDVIVDVCPKGCGLWLDSNELWALQVLFERSLREHGDADGKAMWASLGRALPR